MNIFLILWFIGFFIFAISFVLWVVFLIKKDIDKMLKWNMVLLVGCLLMNLFGKYIK